MPTPSHPARFAVTQTALSVLGAALSGTLWWAHRRQVELPCTAGGGCAQVAASPQAFVTVGPLHGISVALLGFLAYVTLLTLGLLKLAAETPAALRLCRRATLVVTAAGFAYSWHLQWIAHYQLHAFCVWCFASALLMTVLCFLSTLEAWPRRRPSPNAHV